MKKTNNHISILMADDDPDDRMLMQEALAENKIANSIYFVENGEELLDYLNKTGKYKNEKCVTPGIIFLDLNMPKVDGRQALKHLKADPLLRKIPIIILTTSKAELDILESYELGVNSFISKPVRFDELVEVTREISTYWFGTVSLPASK
jgi:two-component system, response regulator